MISAIQTLFQKIGEAGCLVLCLIELAEQDLDQDIDVMKAIIRGIDAGHIHYSWSNPSDYDNMYVEKPADFFSALTGEKWTYHHESADYVKKSDEYEILRWEAKTPAGKANHFTLRDWDPLLYSNTVKNGNVQSKRILRRA